MTQRSYPKGGNRNKLLYTCRDCGANKYVSTVFTNRKGGTRCMDCGGYLEAKSQNAHIKLAKSHDVRLELADRSSMTTPKGI